MNQDPATAQYWSEQLRRDLRWLIDYRDGKVN
jgi:hypothetical protein